MKKFIIALILMLFAQPIMGATTLWNYYHEIGESLPSLSSRAVIYDNIAQDEYRGSYDQNIALLDYLQNQEKSVDLTNIFRTFNFPFDNNENLGGNVPVSATNWTLAAPITSTETTIDLTDFNDLRGNAVATTSMPTKIYFVVEAENSSNAEIVLCLAANGDETNTQFTSCVRGLAFSGTTETAVTANQKSHSAGASVIMTNVGQFFNNFVDIDSAQTVAGVKTYSVSPIVPSPTTDNQVANKAYVDGVAQQGGATSTETVVGISQLATTAEQAGNSFDLNEPQVLSTKYASSTSANNYVMISDSEGELDSSFIGDNNYIFGGGVTLSATTTLADITIGHNVVAMKASTSITGASTPQPVYIASSTNAEAGGVLIVDGDDQDTLGFIGFAITTAATGTTVYVQTDGIVGGFTGLFKGADYYVSDTVGTIATTTGTYDVFVGTAISATEILMQRREFQYIGNFTIANNSSASVRPETRKLICLGLTDDGVADTQSRIPTTLMKKGITVAQVGIRAGDAGSVDVPSFVTYTWSGNTLTTSDEQLSGNATCYMYR